MSGSPRREPLQLRPCVGDGGRAEVAALLLAADQALCEELGGGFAWVAENNSEMLAKLRTQFDELTLEEALAQ